MVKDYQLLDSGNRRKLERFGSVTFDRPEPKALWKPVLSKQVWQQADAIYHRSERGGGSWKFNKRVPESWKMSWKDITFKIRMTNFKHMGLFPEHEIIWDFIQERIHEYSSSENGSNRQPHVLNLFGYTGASTLAAAGAGAKVTHVDASKGTITWARENAELSHLAQKPIRWILEDVVTYCKREVKRGNKYEGIIIDAPAFGRGAKGEVWKFEDNVLGLLDLCRELLSEKPQFVILVSYATEYSSTILEQLLQQYLGMRSRKTEKGELTLKQNNSSFVLPLSQYAVWY